MSLTSWKTRESMVIEEKAISQARGPINDLRVLTRGGSDEQRHAAKPPNEVC